MDPIYSIFDIYKKDFMQMLLSLVLEHNNRSGEQGAWRLRWSNKLCPIAEILFLNPSDIRLWLGFRNAIDHFSRNSNSHGGGAPLGCRLIRGKKCIDLHVHPTAGSADAGVWKSMATGIILENCWFVNNWQFQMKGKGAFLKRNEKGLMYTSSHRDRTDREHLH